MDASTTGPALGQATNGYPRAEVEKFLDDIARERARLQAEIEDSTRRIKRAESAISTHRVMVTMLMQTQRELAQIRRAGEHEADRILQEAESQARALESGSIDVPIDALMTDTHASIDLTQFSSTGESSSDGSGVDPVTWSKPGAPRMDDAASSDEFFTFLRGALVDDQPLGPAAD